MADYKEYVLSTNLFKKPKVLIGKPAIATLLVRIILLEPGTDSINPEMGVGLVSKYRFLTEELSIDLIDNIKYQISKYLPELQCASVDLDYTNDKSVIIKITIDDTIYVFDSSDTDTPIRLESFKN